MDNNFLIPIGRRIAEIRKSHNMSQEKLAELAGCHHTYIGQIERGEKTDILQSLSLRVRGVLAEGYEARKRGDQRSHAADIDAKQKLLVVGREFGKQYRARYVAYHLAGADSGQERVLFKQHREKLIDSPYPRHVSRKQEEANKGQKK